MEERIADERNFSAVLEPSETRIGRTVRKHFAMLGKAVLKAEVRRSVPTLNGVCVVYTMWNGANRTQVVANSLVRLSLMAVREGPSNSITSNNPGLTARPVVATLAA